MSTTTVCCCGDYSSIVLNLMSASLFSIIIIHTSYYIYTTFPNIVQGCLHNRNNVWWHHFHTKSRLAFHPDIKYNYFDSHIYKGESQMEGFIFLFRYFLLSFEIKMRRSNSPTYPLFPRENFCTITIYYNSLLRHNTTLKPSFVFFPLCCVFLLYD